MISIHTLKTYIIAYALIATLITIPAAESRWKSYDEDQRIVRTLNDVLYHLARNPINYHPAMDIFEEELGHIQDPYSLFSVLITASENGQADFVQKLLDHKAPLTSYCSSNNYTPLHLAAQAGHCDVIRVLLAAKANINAQAAVLETPLCSAIEHDQSQAVELLLANGAQAKDSSLHDAAHLGSINVARFLIQKYSEDIGNVNKKILHMRNRTPLHLAAEMGHAAFVELLLMHHADPNATDSKNNTPLMLAKKNAERPDLRHNYTPTINMLLDHGAKDTPTPNEIKVAEALTGLLRHFLPSVHWDEVAQYAFTPGVYQKYMEETYDAHRMPKSKRIQLSPKTNESE